MARVTIYHARILNHCLDGIRTVLSRNGFCWKQFFREGLDADELIDTGDPYLVEVGKLAKEKPDPKYKDVTNGR